MTCPALLSNDLFLSSLLTHLDCQGRSLGATGYQALAAAGSPAMLALTSAMVIFVALYGLRLALGASTAPLRGSVLAAARIGVVLTLAASWPAFQTVLFDVVTRGPDQLAGWLAAGGAHATGPDQFIGELQAADRALVQLTNLGSGRVEFSALPAPGADPSDLPQRIPIADNPAFGWARILFLTTAVAGFAVTRLTAGFLLALTPVFAGLLLFGATRGLFIGWMRALTFTALGSLALTLILRAELGLLVPWLEQLIALRQAKTIIASAPTELLILCLSFAVALTGTFALLLRTAFMTHLPVRPLREIAGRMMQALERQTSLPRPIPALPDQGAPSRALVVADAVAAAQRREAARRRTPALPAAERPVGTGIASAPRTADDGMVIPDFGAAARRGRPRTSLGARLRDRRT